jgi:hypothetical protein
MDSLPFSLLFEFRGGDKADENKTRERIKIRKREGGGR